MEDVYVSYGSTTTLSNTYLYEGGSYDIHYWLTDTVVNYLYNGNITYKMCESSSALYYVDIVELDTSDNGSSRGSWTTGKITTYKTYGQYLVAHPYIIDAIITY